MIAMRDTLRIDAGQLRKAEARSGPRNLSGMVKKLHRAKRRPGAVAGQLWSRGAVLTVHHVEANARTRAASAWVNPRSCYGQVLQQRGLLLQPFRISLVIGVENCDISAPRPRTNPIS